MKLTEGSKVAVVGGGPGGSFASYFLLELASRVDLNIAVDVYEPKDFSAFGPTGCNNCGGIVSESLVQMLAAEGINLPPTVVQRGIDSYVLHTDVGSVAIHDAGAECRIAAVHRGGGTRGASTHRWDSFDGYLLDLARGKGAHVLRTRVEDVTWDGDRPRVHVKGEAQTYDLLGDVRVLKVDKRAFLTRVHEDPSLAFGILEKMADRIRNLDEEVIRLSSQGADAEPSLFEGGSAPSSRGTTRSER